MRSLKKILTQWSAMASRRSYELTKAEDSMDEEDRPFINNQLPGNKTPFLGTSIFNKIMGLINIVLALVLAVSLALLAVSVTHDRDGAESVAGPYCKPSPANQSRLRINLRVQRLRGTC